MAGRYFFAGDAPVVPFRYFMKNDDKFTEPHTPETIAAAFNSAPRDINSIDAYWQSWYTSMLRPVTRWKICLHLKTY